MMALCCCTLHAPFLGAYQADHYLRVAVGCESSVEHAQTASLRGSNVYAVHTLCRIDGPSSRLVGLSGVIFNGFSVSA
jgi:hypothetical protein